MNLRNCFYFYYTQNNFLITFPITDLLYLHIFTEILIIFYCVFVLSYLTWLLLKLWKFHVFSVTLGRATVQRIDTPLKIWSESSNVLAPVCARLISWQHETKEEYLLIVSHVGNTCLWRKSTFWIFTCFQHWSLAIKWNTSLCQSQRLSGTGGYHYLHYFHTNYCPHFCYHHKVSVDVPSNF